MTTYGLLLPHFGSHASRARIVGSATAIEALGFDSVWVRDHVIYQPHDHEDPNRTYLDSFVTLAAVAAVTERITLGTAVLIPHRHPIHTAQLFASLDFLAGGNRVIGGFGIGRYSDEFDAVGMVGVKRGAALEEQVDIMRRIWAGETVSHSGTYYEFENVAAEPQPAGGTVPLWCGGGTTAAIRRTARTFDGWLASRIPRRDFRGRLELLDELAGAEGRTRPEIAVVVQLSPAATVEEALAEVELERLGGELAHSKFTVPESGGFFEWRDFDGVVIPGPPDVMAEEIKKYEALGAQHVILDLRHRFGDWESCVQMLGEELLPILR